MPSSAAAIRLFHDAQVLFAPGKAAQRRRGCHLEPRDEPECPAPLLDPGGWTPASRDHDQHPRHLRPLLVQDDDHVNYAKAAPILPASVKGGRRHAGARRVC